MLAMDDDGTGCNDRGDGDRRSEPFAIPVRGDILKAGMTIRFGGDVTAPGSGDVPPALPPLP